jgi:hypothetical protein
MRVVLLTLTVMLGPVSAAAAIDCGEARRAPAGAPRGVAPLAIGDSVMIGAARQLARRGIEVDARCARNPREGIDVLRERKRRGKLPEIVIFALGTNIAVDARDIRRSLRVLGRRRTLMLVTPFRSWKPFYTRAMRRAAGRHPRRVKLIDWAGRANRNQHWIAGDGTHVQPNGAMAYARLLKRAAWSRQRGRFGRH